MKTERAIISPTCSIYCADVRGSCQEARRILVMHMLSSSNLWKLRNFTYNIQKMSKIEVSYQHCYKKGIES